MSTLTVSASTPAGEQPQQTAQEMEAQNIEAQTRLGAYTALGGSACFIIGAALWIASGVDIDQALANDDMAGYLVAAGGVTPLLVANLCFWIVGALLLGVAATAMTSLCIRRPATAQMALVSYQIGVPLVIVAYLTWLALHLQIVPDTTPAAVLLAETLGWFGSQADWLATILMIGLGPALISLAGRGDWVTPWLARWGIATAITGLLTAIAMFTPSGVTTYGFLTVPVGLIWMIWAGIVLLRRSQSTVDLPNLAREAVS